MHCKSCGKKINLEDRFCSFCGTPVEKKESQVPTLDDLKMIQETELAYKQVNSLQKDLFDEEWEREERRERCTFLIFGALIVILIAAITGGMIFLFGIGSQKSSMNDEQMSNNMSNSMINSNGVGNMSTPDILDDQEIIVTPQLIKPNENMLGNHSQEDADGEIEKPNNDKLDEQIDKSEFVIYDSDRRYLVSADLNNLTAWEIRVARNEIYARHGRMFDASELKVYFETKSWYKPEIPAVEFNISCLNDIELENLKFIINYEKAHNLN